MTTIQRLRELLDRHKKACAVRHEDETNAEFTERFYVETEIEEASAKYFPALIAVAEAAEELSKWTETEPDGTVVLRKDVFANDALADLATALDALNKEQP